jgi:hypothetical protein
MADFTVHIGLNQEVLRSAEPSRPMAFPMHVKVGEHAFPDQDWDDFGVVILGWWLQEVAAFAGFVRDHAIFRFMDGPFELHFRRLDDANWQVKGLVCQRKTTEEFSETVSAASVHSELMRARNEILRAHRAAGVWSADFETLSRSYPH